MDIAEFEALGKKVELAVNIISELKQEKENLKKDLQAALEMNKELEVQLIEKEKDLENMKGELDHKSDNIHQAGERVRDMVSRLEAALA